MKKEDVVDYNSLDEYYSKGRRIKFSDVEFRPETVKDVFVRLNSRDLSETIGPRNGKHCRTGKLRSIDDLIMLCKTYFSNLNLKEILLEIREILDTPVNGDFIYVNYCGYIRKNNFWKSFYPRNNNTTYDNVKFSQNGFYNCNLTIKDIIDE